MIFCKMFLISTFYRLIMKKRVLFCLFIWFCADLEAQNLVLNPSFEELKTNWSDCFFSHGAQFEKRQCKILTDLVFLQFKNKKHPKCKCILTYLTLCSYLRLCVKFIFHAKAQIGFTRSTQRLRLATGVVHLLTKIVSGRQKGVSLSI